MMQLKDLRKYIYDQFNTMSQKQYGFLLRLKKQPSVKESIQNQRQVYQLIQQFKLENLKLKNMNKSIETKLNKVLSGQLALLIFRVRINYKKNFRIQIKFTLYLFYLKAKSVLQESEIAVAIGRVESLSNGHSFEAAHRLFKCQL